MFVPRFFCQHVKYFLCSSLTVLGSVLSGPWVHQLTLQPLPPVLQVWLPVFKVCPDTVECNLGSERCEKSCVSKELREVCWGLPTSLGSHGTELPLSSLLVWGRL